MLSSLLKIFKVLSPYGKVKKDFAII